MADKCILLLLLTFVTFTTTSAETVMVSTSLGMIAGEKKSISNKTEDVYTFMGIPYAKPPVGNLRFEKPVPYGRWTGTLNASVAGKICIQDTYPGGPALDSMSEDCLFLNVYVPNTLSGVNKKSVMVWIHGGGYFSGSGDLYGGSSLAAHGDVIVVTINYRLGIFGFFNLDDGKTRGNYGIWDQILALKWVNKYISYFGGNPSSVTIFGESAGGWSVSLLSMIPSNKGLFQRVIAQSGVANSLLAYNVSHADLSLYLGLQVSCVNSTTLTECMREKDTWVVQNAYSSYVSLPEPSVSFKFAFTPVIDNELFRKTPDKILFGPPSAALRFFRSLDMIVGNTDAEGSIAVAVINSKGTPDNPLSFNLSLGIPNDFFTSNVLPTLVKDYFSDNQAIQNAICDEYCVYNDTAEQGRQVVDMFGDLFFISPSVYNLYAHSVNNIRSNTYQFIFSKPFPSFLGEEKTWFKGSSHASELVYLFDVDLTGFDLQNPFEGRTLAEDMQTYWTNFAKYGNPNGGSNMAAWPAYDCKNRYFLRLDDVTRAEMDYSSDRVKFWLKDISDLMKKADGSNPMKLSLLFSSIFGG